MKTLYKLIVFLVLQPMWPAEQITAQLTFDWAATQGAKNSDLTSGVLQDHLGHLYSLGFMNDTTYNDPGNEEIIAIPWFTRAYVLSKWTTEGEFKWAGVFQTPGNTSGAIDQIIDSHIYIHLKYTDSLIYEHPSGTLTLRKNPGQHLCIIVMDLDGVIIEVHDLFDSHGIDISRLEKTNDTTFLVAGDFNPEMTLSTQDGDTTLFSTGKDDAFIMSMNTDWKTNWVFSTGSAGHDFVADVYVANNLIYLGIGYNDTLTLVSHGQPVTFPCKANEENILFGTLTLSGKNLKVQSIGSDQNDEVRHLAADHQGNIYLCGQFTGSVNFAHPADLPELYTSQGEADGYIAKYSPDFHLEWVRVMKDEHFSVVSGLVLHREQYLYLSGVYAGKADLDPGPDSLIVSPPDPDDDAPDMYVMKLDTDGELKWVYHFTSYSSEGIVEISVSTDGYVYLSGFHFDVFDADPSPAEFLVPNQGGGSDLFILAFQEENVITSIETPNDHSLYAYPNPFTDHFVISGTDPIERVSVFSLSGSLLPVPVTYQHTTAQVNTQNLPSGMFVTRIKTTSGFSTIRMVKP